MTQKKIMSGMEKIQKKKKIFICIQSSAQLYNTKFYKLTAAQHHHQCKDYSSSNNKQHKAMSSTCDAVLSSLRACRQFAEGLEETNVNTIDPSPSSSSKSSTQTKTDSVTISLFTNTRQTLETYISKTGSQRMKQVHIRTVKDAAIVLYNRSKPLTSVPDLAGVMKYVSGLALRLVAHTRLQVCSVFESAAQSFIAAKDRRYSSAAIPANVVGVLDIQLLTCCYYIHHSFSLLPLISFLFSVSNSVLFFFSFFCFRFFLSSLHQNLQNH